MSTESSFWDELLDNWNIKNVFLMLFVFRGSEEVAGFLLILLLCPFSSPKSYRK